MACIRTEQLIQLFQKGEINFDRIVIAQAALAGGFLPFISLEEAHLHQADFRHAVLPGAKLHRAYLVESNFEHANLLGVDLSLANLNQARLDHSLLASANLKRVILRGASLIGARLANADLSFADLRNVNLVGANLQGANLSKANLFGSRLAPNALEYAILNSTIMPNGHRYSGDGKDYVNSPTTPLDTAVTHADWTNQPPPEKTSRPDRCHEIRDKRIGSLPESKRVSNLKVDDARRQKIVGFRLSENSADLILEILDDLTTQDKGKFICINHFL